MRWINGGSILRNSDQLFDVQFESELCKVTGLDAATVATLARSFEPIGQHFRDIIEATPTDFENGPQDIPRKVRLKWLRTNLQRPLGELNLAISEPAKLSAKPDILPSGLTDSEWTELTRLLDKLSQYSDELCDCFEGRIADESTVNAELRFDLVCKLADACGKADVTVSRDHHCAMEDISAGPIVIRAACKVICGKPFSLDHHLRDYLTFTRAKKLTEG